jgi:hypothetical protein
MTTAYAILSISEYSSFEPLRASETKYMSTYVSAPSIVRSSTRAVLTAALDVEMYKSNSAFSEGLDITAKFSMYYLRASKAFTCSLPHSMLPEPFNALKNGRHFSADLEMNRFSKANLPFNFCTPFFVVGGFIHLMASIFSGFASIPLSVIMQPSNLPLRTP